MSNQDVATYLEMCNKREKLRIETAGSKASGFYKKFKGITQAQAAFFYWLFGEINAEKCEEFFYLLTTGDGIGSTKNSGIWLLRQRLEKMHHSTVATDLNIRNALIIKGWNLFRTQTSVKQIHWDDRAPFPIAK